MPPRLNIPPLTRSFFVCLVVFTFLNAAIQPDFTPLSPFTRTGDGTPYLTIIPGISIKYPWTFATATLVEQNIFGLIVTGLTLFFGGRYLERAYGSAEYAKYVLFVSMLPNILCFTLYVLFFYISGSENALYVKWTKWTKYVNGHDVEYWQANHFPRRTATISGALAIQASFLVSFKQLVPEHTVSVAKGLLRCRVKHFPAIFLLANTLSAILFGTETAAFLAWLGFFVSWTYLRFYRTSPALTSATGGDAPTVKGDASDTFAFVEFFPEPTHPLLSPLCNGIYALLVTLHICTPFSPADIELSNESAAARTEGGLPSIMGRGSTGRREEAERRRALALAALDQRLSVAAARPNANNSLGVGAGESGSASSNTAATTKAGEGPTNGGEANDQQ